VKKPVLLVLVSDFPYGNGEPFFEHELPFLAAEFDVYIWPINCYKNIVKYYIPSNVTIVDSGLYTHQKSILDWIPLDFLIESRFILSLGIKSILSRFRSYIYYSKNSTRLSKSLSSWIKKNGHSLNSLYLYSYWFDIGAISIARFRIRNPQVYATVRAHGWDVYMSRHDDSYLPLRTYVLKSINRLRFVSKSGFKYYLEQFDSSLVSNCSIDYLGTPDLTPLFWSKTSTLKLLSIAYLSPVKQLNFIADALGMLPKDLNVVWTHIGGGSDEHVEKFKVHVNNALDSNPLISFDYRGSLSKNHLHALLSSEEFDLFLNSSSSEGIPVSMMEALSVGIPILAPDVGGIAEIVNNDTGILLPTNFTPKEITKALQDWILLDENSQLDFRFRARLFWEENFRAQSNYSKFTVRIKNRD